MRQNYTPGLVFPAEFIEFGPSGRTVAVSRNCGSSGTSRYTPPLFVGSSPNQVISPAIRWSKCAVVRLLIFGGVCRRRDLKRSLHCASGNLHQAQVAGCIPPRMIMVSADQNSCNLGSFHGGQARSVTPDSRLIVFHANDFTFRSEETA